MASRRKFLRTACVSFAASICGGTALTTIGCSNIPTVKPLATDGGLLVPLDALIDSKSVIVKRGLKPPIVIHKNQNSDYKALLLLCTHKACQPVVFEYSLDCPCHGSQFNFEGEVLTGPANANLKSFPIDEDGAGNLLITIDQ
ncbi:MAG: hypothetical protein CMG75_01110 [Candidatus Marinimicrobia bacterium]|nr:hypothetical protein [Candidatus Neomarinimicrobiota bacterium]|tara:strand:- start:7906 stop:8334 length:429 start_codon:yes stop_codon:yes gene_type:complete